MLGWGEFELEVMRDRTDNVVIVCSIENLDPMGVHTGDSVCVAPQQTLHRPPLPAAARPGDRGDPRGRRRDRRLERPVRRQPRDRGDRRDRDEPARVALERAGVEGDRLPDREDRRAARGRLHARRRSRTTSPGDARELRAGDRLLRGQVAAVRVREVPGRRGRTDDAHEVGRRGDGDRPHVQAGVRQGAALARARPRAAPRGRPRAAAGARRAARAPSASTTCSRRSAAGIELDELYRADRASTRGSCASWPSSSAAPQAPFVGERTFKSVDTCAAEFEARTPYFYSAWERAGADGPSHEVDRGARPSVVILGSGPNRIGQGIEFDYCCVHAAQTVRESGRDAVMINCNPETVSTDYDTSDRLYFEPLTLEDVLAVCELEQPEAWSSSSAARRRSSSRPDWRDAGFPILGTSIDAIDLAEDRARFGALLERLGYKAPRTRPRARTRRRSSAPRTSASRCSCGRATCSAAARWRSSTTSTACATICASSRLGAGRSDDLPRPLPRGLDRGRRRRALRRRRTSGSRGSCSTSRRPGSTRATRPACCRRTRSARRCSTQIRDADGRESPARSASSGC